VTARVVTLLARVGRAQDREPLARALDYLRREQEEDGSWFGRWGTNYVYGTWSVLMALGQAGFTTQDTCVRRAVAWLKGRQNEDGGWGESNDSYSSAAPEVACMASTAYQTAWALLGLCAVGEGTSEASRRGVRYLLRRQETDGLWQDPSFTAPGFPRVFYLRYHGYSAFFPLWALAAYRTRLKRNVPP
jgi:squalene-hopene/tetraprenyl-beta-curcumene cyclase